MRLRGLGGLVVLFGLMRAAGCLLAQGSTTFAQSGTMLAQSGTALGQGRTIAITQRYLNVPVERNGAMRIYQIGVGGVVRREFPVQLAEGVPDYWIFVGGGDWS
jgi:hypothetical protein